MCPSVEISREFSLTITRWLTRRSRRHTSFRNYTTHRDAALPACQGCARIRPVEHSLEDGRRVCGSCRRKALAEPCGRCGKHRFLSSRLDGTRVCDNCYANDERNRKTCVSCGRRARKAVRAANGILCQTCAPRKKQTCFRCSEGQPVGGFIDDRPFCKRCYMRTTTAFAPVHDASSITSSRTLTPPRPWSVPTALASPRSTSAAPAEASSTLSAADVLDASSQSRSPHLSRLRTATLARS